MCFASACFIADLPVGSRDRVIGQYHLRHLRWSGILALHDDGTFDQMLTDTTGRVDSCSGTWKYSSAPDGGVIQLNGVFNVVEHVIFRKTSFATEPYFRRGRVCIKVNEDSLYLHD